MCVEVLTQALADTFAFYMKAHISHWNVTGPNFPQYHSFFQTIYEDAHGAVDDLAEKIRTLGADAPRSPVALICATGIDMEEVPDDADSMLACLAKANEIVKMSLSLANQAAEAVGKVGIANFLQERIDRHAKWGWMLEATMDGKDPFVAHRRSVMYDRMAH